MKITMMYPKAVWELPFMKHPWVRKDNRNVSKIYHATKFPCGKVHVIVEDGAPPKNTKFFDLKDLEKVMENANWRCQELCKECSADPSVIDRDKVLNTKWARNLGLR